MRRLLYVPIIHDEADLGSAGSALAQGSAALSGQRRWAAHQEVARGFWQSVASYLSTLAPGLLRVYQDGLAADGERARRVVEEAARRGSRNYQLVLELLQRGAEVRKTEDPALLWQEHENVRRSVQEPSGQNEGNDAPRYRRERDRLMEERDRFIAAAINATLQEGEVGLLFIGAYHDVARHLAPDIVVEPVKDMEMVRAYFQDLLGGHDEERLKERGQYLGEPVRRE